LIDHVIGSPHKDPDASAVEEPKLVSWILLLPRKIGAAGAQAGEFFVIILQGAALTSFGFLLTKANLLWWGLVILSCADVLLWLVQWLFTARTDSHRQRWLCLNLLTVILLGSQALFALPFSLTLSATVMIISLADYIANWNFYFPER